MPKILVVEDSSECQLLIRGSLAQNYQTVMAGTAKEAREAAQKGGFDLILLDVNLPDQSGFALCTEWRATDALRDTPILFLTGRSDVHDKVAAFTAGAEDYIVKPFEPLELRARVEARVQRRLSNQERAIEVIRRDLKLQLDMQRAFLSLPGGDKELQLTPIEFKILHTLIKNEDRVLSREQIIQHVWGSQVFLVERIIDKHVSTLRSKLKPRSEYIQTVSGVGYRFAAK